MSKKKQPYIRRCPACRKIEVPGPYIICETCWPEDRDEQAMAAACGPLEVRNYWLDEIEAGRAKAMPFFK